MSIQVSAQHGVNPTVPRCYFCNEAKNEVVLMGRLPKDAEAPHDVVIDMSPCDTCRELMDQGVLVISIRDGESASMADAQARHNVAKSWCDISKRDTYPLFIPNPIRSGSQWVIKEEGFRTALVTGLGAPVAIVDRMCELRWAFLDDKICTALGLEPAGEEDGEQTGVDVPGRSEAGD